MHAKRIKKNELQFVSHEQYEEYLKNGLSHERIKQLNAKRSKAAFEARTKFNQHDFPYVTMAEFEKLLMDGWTVPMIKKRATERRVAYEKYRSRITLRSFKPHPPEEGMEARHLNIVLLGISGEGKNSTRKTILGEDSSSSGVSSSLVKGTNRFVKVTKFTLSEDYPKSRLTGRTFDGTDAFLLVVNIANHRDLKTQAVIWRELKEKLGADFVSRCLLVLTHADVSLRYEDLSDLYRSYVSKYGYRRVEFGDVMQELHPRIIALNNNSQDPHIMKIQRDTILSMIDTVVPRPKQPVPSSGDLIQLETETDFPVGHFKVKENCHPKDEMGDALVHEVTKQATSRGDKNDDEGKRDLHARSAQPNNTEGHEDTLDLPPDWDIEADKNALYDIFTRMVIYLGRRGAFNN